MCRADMKILVGALTSKPYAFAARAWELKSFESLDFFDGLAGAIRYDVRGTEIMRVLPIRRDSLNEDWISDKVRFMYDGLKRQRILKPYKRVWLNGMGTLLPVSWDKALKEFSSKWTEKVRIEALYGNSLDLETAFTLKGFVSLLGSEGLTSVQGDIRSHYLFQLSFDELEESDLVVLVGCNPRFEAPILNLRLRKAVLRKSAFVALIGNLGDLTYEAFNFGNISAFFSFIEGKSKLSVLYSRASNPKVILGESFCHLEAFLTSTFTKVFPAIISSIYPLRSRLGDLSSFELGLAKDHLLTTFSEVTRWLYLLDQDELDTAKKELFSFAGFNFVVYQGHHGDRSAGLADLVFPGTLPIEKSSIFLNVFGELKRAKFLGFHLGESRIDWKIFVALSNYVGKSLSPDSYSHIVSSLEADFGLFTESRLKTTFDFGTVESPVDVGNSSYSSSIEDFYQNDNITRSSIIMALTSSRFNKMNRVWK